ncbi:MAG: TIGR04283 family arsenosugar biosynthesis glycosyltransferase [Bacillota bacterium]|nr:TIGR04283 family arsenosugar biosynthesis glycosyltransferase [Bacillota bacterium]
MIISVIVPTCNEESLLPACLESILREPEDIQLIVVDGASNDNTLNVARRYTDEIIVLDIADLSAQLNKGAEKAEGDILLFLHADTRLTPGCISRLKKIPSHIIGGAFTMQLEGDRFFYRLLSLGGNLYCRLTGSYFGDRGIFVRKSSFRDLNGFNALPIMADVDFSARLKSLGKTILLKGPLISSSRKFKTESPLRTLYLIIYALIAFKFGVDPGKIKNKYYHLPKK